MACYHGLINRLRLAFDPSEGDYFEWNHNGNFHCFHEETVDKVLMPLFKEWYAQKTESNLWDAADIDLIFEENWDTFLVERETDIIEHLDDIAESTEITIGGDPECYTESYGLSVGYGEKSGEYYYDTML